MADTSRALLSLASWRGKAMVRARFQGAADIEDEAFKRAFVEDRLVIDCVEIRLVQNGTSTPIEYMSAGSIEAGANKGVVVRLVCPRSAADSHDPLKFLMSLNGPDAGVILPDEHYYRLEAKDVAGDTWVCEAGELDRSDREDTVVLSFTSGRIRCSAVSEAKKPYAFFVFLDDLDFPKNTVRTTTVEKRGEPWGTRSDWNLSEGDAGGLHIYFDGIGDRVERRYSELVARGDEGASMPAGFEDRVLEAIRFCTASMATPVMSQVGCDGKKVLELTRSRALNKGLVEPPVSHRSHGEHFYRLFGCFYQYACKHAAGKDYSPLSAKVGGLFALKGVWVETVVLLLSVAIERMLNEDDFARLGKPAAEVRAEVDQILAAAAELELSESMRNRVQGALNGFKTNTPADRMNALIDAGVLVDEDRKTWKKSRNASTHGSFEIEPEEFQKVIDDAFRLLTMIYKMAFFCVGYSGPYTNFSIRSWPTYVFDLAAYRTALYSKHRDTGAAQPTASGPEPR
ncbi:hypothetical protein J2X16_004890 [Pelomonas aquatica]|uniref:ApeA N-terminal domain-containing protein n=1 Tax=Pelomonas aquatica TaxID=431058 RepID=A0ABU1ZHQ0_9BURK|nr:hypothetical protein [Pelomonas aquatica]MDR7299520.1 hypothetical protein [Pelomonas aquatica]